MRAPGLEEAAMEEHFVWMTTRQSLAARHPAGGHAAGLRLLV